eukprot:TRINITY_DN24242_c0_g1_i1.p1 TRINITY_DN24242_c0_g1~~TRINITY_DN24242_c0_g1_i1.p1  ORF type:complete len:124 (+),score=71.63 TRINITY_DN24242_c0_g1_i1:117-488(+)
MIRLPPRSTQSRSSAASDVYKRQLKDWKSWKATFDAEDQKAKEFASDEERQERIQLMAEFEVMAAKWKAAYKRQAEMRAELRGYTTEEEEESVEVTEYELTVVDTKEELMLSLIHISEPTRPY